jgi:hypothetical protein
MNIPSWRLVVMVFGVLSQTLTVEAQQKFTFSGYVKDSLSGESLIGATINIYDQGKGVTTNPYGFYSITLPQGKYSLWVSFTGYKPLRYEVNLTKDVQQNLLLSPQSLLKEVVVYSRRRDENVKNAQMGRFDLAVSQIKSVPVIFGEVDILKTLQLLPGIRNAGEGNTGLYVRGGGPDQNLILLDEAIVYNSAHLFGFFSIFNSDAIKNISLIKGGMPAQYGGRLSSVLDVSMKDGNMNKTEVEGGIGLIASRLAIQGPIKKNKASYMFSARRTYIDVLYKPFLPRSSSFYGSGYYFYDWNGKINYRFSEKDRLYLSGYFGRDVFQFNNNKRSFSSNIPWGNSTASLRWNHVFNKKLFSNTTLVYNDYYFSFAASQNDFDLRLNSGIRDFSVKYDMDYYPAPQHRFKFGALHTYHRFTPNVLNGSQGETRFDPNNEGVKYAGETAAYVQHEWELGDKVKINSGLRYSNFSQLGPYTIYDRDADGNKVDSTRYARGQRIKSYGGWEPRVTLRYAWNDESSFKFSVTRNLQYVHLVSNAGTTLPTDLWVPSTYRVKPQIGLLYAAGLFKNFQDNAYETSFEVYYKDMHNQIEYREGYTQSLKDPEEDFVFGKGWSYGAEFFVRKSKGKWTGWVGYTLSWTWRKFPGLNGGMKYPAKYDRRHDLSLVAMYDQGKKWKFSGVFVYATGNATTLPERFYLIGGVLTQEYSAINKYRMPAYHRMDLSATLTPRKKDNTPAHHYWVFSIYNVYSRMNPYFLYYDQQGNAFDGTLKVDARQVSLFPVLPSVTWNFKF